MSDRRTKLILAVVPAVLIALLPAAALAHPGHVHAGGDAFAAGLLHPLSGADHLSALLLAGGWSAFQGRRQLRLPGVLLAAMIVGFLASPSVGSAFAEMLIALSVVALTVAVVLRLRAPMTLAMSALALFGFGHGLAHGIESSGTSLAFMAGMLATSATLLALGGAAGLMLNRHFQAPPTRD